MTTLFVLLTLAFTGAAIADGGMANPEPASGALSAESLKNATYQGIYDKAVALTAGRYAGKPFVEGGASRPTLTYLDAAWGDLTGDGADEALVALAENSGGSGVFIYLAVVVDRDRRAVNVATTLLQDRVRIDSLKINNGQAVIEMLSHRPDDPLCCPTRQVVKKFKLDGGKLLETPNEVAENDPTDARAELIGITWSWLGSSYNNDTRSEVAVPGDFTITFNADGSFNGKADCNNFSGSYTLQGSSISIRPGPMTMAICPQQALVDQYLKDLGAGPFTFSKTIICSLT